MIEEWLLPYMPKDLAENIVVPVARTIIVLVVSYVYSAFFYHYLRYIPEDSEDDSRIDFAYFILTFFYYISCISYLTSIFFIVSYFLFALMISVSLRLSKYLQICNFDTAIKTCVLVYAFYLRSIADFIIVNTQKSDGSTVKIDCRIDCEFLITVTAWILKLLCVAEEYNNKSLDEIKEEEDIALRETMYVTSPGWLPYKEFYSLSRREPVMGPHWKMALRDSALLLIGYKILAEANVFAKIFAKIFWPGILVYTSAAQYRYRYYYLAELAQFHAIAVGVKRDIWSKHWIFGMTATESAMSITEALKTVNFPVSFLMTRQFANSSKKKILLNLVYLLSVVGCLDSDFAKILAVFILSVFTQKLYLAYFTRDSPHIFFLILYNSVHFTSPFLLYTEVPFSSVMNIMALIISTDLSIWFYCCAKRCLTT